MRRAIRQRLAQTKRWQWVTAAVLVAAGLSIWGTYRTRWWAADFWGIINDEIAVVTIEQESGDGQDSSTETITITDPSKSFWDGLQLLGVPLVLAGLGAWFQRSQQEQAERAAKAQREQDADEAREEVLQRYFDRVSELLVNQNLREIARLGESADPAQKELLEAARDLIRARTLSMLRRFETDIERLVVQRSRERVDFGETQVRQGC